MIKNVIMPGDQFAEKGTVGWADWQRSRMKHALKDVNFEAKQITQVIRDMCAGKRPAWHLMTRNEGAGFRTFEEFVVSPEGLGYPDYLKFRGVALSDPGAMTEREYDLLTLAPGMDAATRGSLKGKEEAIDHKSIASVHPRVASRLRAIKRAPLLIRRLYDENLIDKGLAAFLGPDPDRPGYLERQTKAGNAMAAINAIRRNGNAAAYRKAVNEAVRSAFGLTDPPALERAKRVVRNLTPADQKRLRRWMDAGMAAG
jgi:hypothetical protein